MNWNLLHKYLAGECDAVERRLVEKWLNENPENVQFMDSLKEIWKVKPTDTIEVDVQNAWQTFEMERLPVAEMERIGNDEHSFSGHYQKVERHNNLRFPRTILNAAAAAAIIFFTVIFYQQITQQNVEVADERIDQIIETDRGERTSVLLPDGSHIGLNADSKVIIPAGFPEESREIYLEGEAYFDVQSDKNKPFIVNSAHTFTRVLGTKFGVRAYNDEDRTHAVVEEGEVMVGYQHSDEGEVILKRNDLAKLSHNPSADIDVQKVDNLDEYIGWRNGDLIFTNTPFDEVEKRLERWFDIELEIEDSTFYAKNLTASFKNEPLTEVLNVVSLSLDGEYQRDGRLVTFKNNQQ